MRPPYQTYLDNMTAVRALVRPRLAPNLADDAVLSAIHTNATCLFAIHRQNDAILDEILFSRHPETLSAEDAASLSELADALFNFNRSADVGIAYRIHQLLYNYALFHNDLDLKIRELYFQGITLHYLNVRSLDSDVNLFVDKIGSYFRAGAAYLKQYEEIENPETRAYIIRCLCSLPYGLRSIQGGTGQKSHTLIEGWHEYMDVFNRAMDVIGSPRYREMDPQIPWDHFCYAMHYDRTQFLSSLRTGFYPDVAKAVLESAEYVHQHPEQAEAAGIRTQYIYSAARYHNGEIGLEELLRVLLSICEEAQLGNYSSDNIWALLTCPEYLKHYVRFLPMERQNSLGWRIQRILDKQINFLFHMPPNEYSMHITSTLQATTEHATSQDAHFSYQILNYLLACHPPTYVHSKVVAMLTRRICAQFARTDPEKLDGMFGMRHPAADPVALDALFEQAYFAGLYHDMGKCMLLSYVGQYSRRLLDEEFACIKLHPDFGSTLLQNLRMRDLAYAAGLHHRFYDERGGYPADAAECPISAGLIVDIITVVDSLEAGTDNVGRSYAASKTYEQLIEELREGKGHRYAPDVVALFDDPEFYEQTKQFLDESRQSAYLTAYRTK